MSDTPNINIGGISGGQNNIGKNEIAGNQTQNIGAFQNSPTSKQMIEHVSEAIRRIDPALAADVIPQLTEIEAMAPEQQHEETTLDHLRNVCKRLQPYGKVIWQTLATFGQGALESLAKSNPVINGIWQVCKQHATPTS